MLARRSHGVLLRIAPAIPCPLYRAVDKLEPLRVRGAIRWRRQGEHLPHPVIAHDRHDWLAARPAYMSIGVGMVRVGGHQSLLHRKNKVMRGVQRSRRNRWVSPSEADLQRADRFTQVSRRFGPVLQAKSLDIVEQDVGLREQQSPASFGGVL
ncbi:MAG TPA: hypothetical protein VGS16_01030 [Candidatus Dormibacteraeota bacterium]|nr:hypothetical protein [Candidatus Dormibacteraeota bacterium]